MSKYVSKQQQYGQLWIEEAENFYWDEDILDTASSAELPDELDHLWDSMDTIEDFDGDYSSWEEFILANNLPLALEQSCYQGVLLPLDQRAVRLESCDEKMLSQLRWFFQYCPPLIQALLAMQYATAVRIDRARRTGNPDWSPKKAIPNPEPHAFFRPPLVKYRGYGR